MRRPHNAISGEATMMPKQCEMCMLDKRDHINMQQYSRVRICSGADPVDCVDLVTCRRNSTSLSCYYKRALRQMRPSLFIMRLIGFHDRLINMYAKKLLYERTQIICNQKKEKLADKENVNISMKRHYVLKLFYSFCTKILKYKFFVQFSKIIF